MVRALDFYPGDPGSNPIRDVGCFQTKHHLSVTNFHIRNSENLKAVSNLDNVPVVSNWARYDLLF